MAKFTDAVRATLTGYYNAGDQPTEAQFTALILAIQEGIEEHDHSGTGDGDGVSDLVGPLTGTGLDVPDGWYLGIGAALERIVFDAAGDIIVMGANFGIGMAAPDHLLTVGAVLNNAFTPTPDFSTRGAVIHGIGTAKAELHMHRDDLTIADGDIIGSILFSSSDAAYQVGAKIVVEAHDDWAAGDTPTEIQFFTSPDGGTIAQAAVITHDKCLGVGVAAPTAGYQAHIRSVDAVARMKIETTGVADLDVLFMWQCPDESWYWYINDGDAQKFVLSCSTTANTIIVNTAGAIQFGAYGAGDLQTDAAGNITAVSDARLKEQVRNTEIGLAEVLQMQGKAWHYTKESGLDTEYEYLGFIANDIEKIVPGAVGQMSDGMKTLSTSSLLPAFAKAIQELDARLTQLGG